MATFMSARHVAARIGRQVIALGGALRLIGVVLLIVVVSAIGIGGSVGWLIPALIINGAGTGLAVAPLAATVLSRITSQHAGAASGALTTGIQVGNAFGVAIIGVMFFGTLTRGRPTTGAPAHAFATGLTYVAAISAVLITLVQLLPKTAKPK